MVDLKLFGHVLRQLDPSIGPHPRRRQGPAPLRRTGRRPERPDLERTHPRRAARAHLPPGERGPDRAERAPRARGHPAGHSEGRASSRTSTSSSANDPAEGADLIRDLVATRLPAKMGFDPRTDIQVLAPMYRGHAGADHLNEMLQEALDGQARRRSRAASVTFRVGDRVIFTRNDYERDLANGDLGRVIVVDHGGRASCEVRFAEAVHRFESWTDLKLAFALTVHKSQGSEYPVVILPLFFEHRAMLRRGVIYTAMTRARRLLIIVGQAAALAARAAGDPARRAREPPRAAARARRGGVGAPRRARGGVPRRKPTGGRRPGEDLLRLRPPRRRPAATRRVRRGARRARRSRAARRRDHRAATSATAPRSSRRRSRSSLRAAPHRIYVPGNHELWASDAGRAPGRANATSRSSRASRARPGSIRSSPSLSWSATSGSSERWAGTTTRSPIRPTDTRRPRSRRSRATASSGWTAASSAGRAPTATRSRDQEVADLLAEDLRDQIEALAGASLRTIVLVTHHLAVPQPGPAGVRRRPPQVLPRVPRVRTARRGGARGAPHLARPRRPRPLGAFDAGGRDPRVTCPMGYPKRAEAWRSRRPTAGCSSRSERRPDHLPGSAQVHEVVPRSRASRAPSGRARAAPRAVSDAT